MSERRIRSPTRRKRAVTRGPAPRGVRRAPHASAPVIGVVGLGYVGLATALAFAEHGRRVRGYDIVAGRREQLRRGESPFEEPGFPALLRRALRKGSLTIEDALEPVAAEAELLFICVPTPSLADGRVDLEQVREASRNIGRALPRSRGWKGVVLKSTAVPGTTMEVVRPEVVAASGRTPGVDLGVAANPEFLAEGSLVRDALHPSRIVLGAEDRRTARALERAYRGFPGPRVHLSPTAAELVKYASNALLATKVSYANEVARVASEVGVDVYPVLAAVGLDPRLGGQFLRAGPGFGGSCFGKDLRALAKFAEDQGLSLELPRAVLAANEAQARHVVDLAERAAGSLRDRAVALLGLAFKAGTSDTRESQAYPILYELLRRGASVRLHDPVAEEPFRSGLDPGLPPESLARVSWSATLEDALRGADLAILHDDWPEYRRASPGLWGALHGRLVVDARRTVDPRQLARKGVRYVAVGR